jgi:hypothetical protein
MKPQDFVKEFNRMCESNRKKCNGCQFVAMCSCNLLDIKPEEFAQMYDAVAEWSDSNPVKTRQSEFLKMFPRAKVRDGVISLCPQFYCITLLGTDFTGCNPNDCAKCLREYWLAEVTDND